jgi:hypothetical protein
MVAGCVSAFQRSPVLDFVFQCTIVLGSNHEDGSTFLADPLGVARFHCY